MEYINTILGHVEPIISAASKSSFGLISLGLICVAAIVLLFLFLTARTHPVLSFILAATSLLVIIGGAFGIVLSVDVRKPAIVYDVDMLKRLQKIDFKIPNLPDKDAADYELLDGVLQLLPNGTWNERQDHPRGVVVVYAYKQVEIIPGKIDYRRLDDTVELFVDFPQRKICWRETAPRNGTANYRCPYAVVSFD
jgi:hypothetical protein